MLYLYTVRQLRDPPILDVGGGRDYSHSRILTSFSWMCECGAKGEISGYIRTPLERLWCSVCGENVSWEELCKQAEACAACGK